MIQYTRVYLHAVKKLTVNSFNLALKTKNRKSNKRTNDKNPVCSEEVVAAKVCGVTLGSHGK